jgi:hypothetical protein
VSTDDALFPQPEPEPEHPDTAIAREEITRYYEHQLSEARTALAEAQHRFDTAAQQKAEWTRNGRITPDMLGDLDLAAHEIAAFAIDRWHQACKPLLNQMRAVGGRVVNTDPEAARTLRAEVDRLGAREVALRRWLTAHGYDLGALAEPAPKRKPPR